MRLAVLVQLAERAVRGADPVPGDTGRRGLDQPALGGGRTGADLPGLRHAGRSDGNRLRSAHKIRRTVLIGAGTAEVDRIDVVPDALTRVGIEVKDLPAGRDLDLVPVVGHRLHRARLFVLRLGRGARLGYVPANQAAAGRTRAGRAQAPGGE